MSLLGSWLLPLPAPNRILLQGCVALNLILAFGKPGQRYRKYGLCGRRDVTADIALENVVKWELVVVPLVWTVLTTMFAGLGWLGQVAEDEPYECCKC